MNSKISLDLGLSDIKVEEVKIDKKGVYHIHVSSTLTKGVCHKCGKEITKFHGLDREMEIRHLPILGKECYIHIRLPRFECEECKKHPKTTGQVEWRRYNSSCTKAFEEHILNSLTNSTMSDVSWKENISEGKIRRILENYYPDKVKWGNIEEIGQIGIDEISLKKRA